MYSLSTCWNSHRHTDGRQMLLEIRQLGFEYAELSHGIRISLLPGIFDAVGAGEIKISSLHNFCPLPIGINYAAPNVFKFTSLNARERENAYRHTVKTIETAARLGAKVVVLHMGSLEIKDYTEKLIGMLEAGQKESTKFEKICREVTDKREQKKEKSIQAAYEMLKRLVEVAASAGVALGIENREALEEIPFESDFPFFFKEFGGPTVGYWHDTGHAQIKENLGFIHHATHLESLTDQLLGFHIHDVQFPARDHCPPGTGMIDFGALAAVVRPEHIKVLELNPGVAPEHVRQGMEHIQQIWGNA